MSEVIVLIQPVPVVRDADGMFWHPDAPQFEEGDEEKSAKWLDDQRLEVKTESLEYAGDDISERYFESGDPDCSYWEPAKPDGDGWFCLAIEDTDSGPKCWWVRRPALPEINRYNLATLKDVFAIVPADRIRDCMNELGILLSNAAYARDLFLAVAEDAGLSPESVTPQLPDSFEWVDDGLGDVSLEVRGGTDPDAESHEVFTMTNKVSAV